MIVVHSSVWIDHLRGTATPQVTKLRAMLGADQAVRAAALYRGLRAKGVTIRKTIDLIIGAWCIANDASLLHSDSDFTQLERHAGLQVA